MPVITIDTWPLKESDKPVIMTKITEVFTSMGLPAQAVTIIIKETSKENWASAGEQHSQKFK